MDVRSTLETLTGLSGRVHCLALGGMDLTSLAGKMTMGVIAAVAESERDLLMERTNVGPVRAKAEGKQARAKSNSPPAISPSPTSLPRSRCAPPRAS